jgi:hypothetical protein
MLHHALRAKGIISSASITPAFVKSVISSTSTIATGTVAVGDLLVLVDYCISSSPTIPTTTVPSGYTVLNNYGAITGTGASTRTTVSYKFSTVTTTTTLTGMSSFGQRKTLLVFNGGGSSVAAVNFSNITGGSDPAAITSAPSSSQNTITAVAQSTAVQNTSSSSITVNVPTGTSNGDLMIMVATLNDTLTFWSTPSGWIEWGQSLGRAVFYRTASSEPASYTITQGNSNTSSAAILTYRNAVPDTIGVFSVNVSPSVAAAITTTDSNSYVFDYIAGRTNASQTYTTPTGFTSLVSDTDSTAPSYQVFYKTQATAGSTGTATSTTSSGAAMSIQFSIKPTYPITSPIITIANYQTNTSGAVNFPIFSPPEDGTVTNTVNQTIKYKIFQSAGASVSIDTGLNGTYSINGVGGLQIT